MANKFDKILGEYREKDLEIGVDVAAQIHAIQHAVSGIDTVFPTDPGSDKYLKWDDDPGVLIWADAAGGGDALVANPLSQFAATTSAQLAGVISDETGTDKLVFNTAPTFATSITGSYLTASEMLITDGSKNIISAAVATYPSLTELAYVKGVTSAIQTQLGTKLALAGGTMTGDIQLGETDIKLDAVLSADETWSGIVISGTAGAQLVVGEICYLASSGKWLKNDGILDGTDTGFSKKLGICVLAAAGDTDPTEILKYGKIRSAKFPALTVGSPAYLSDTAGEIVVAQPSTTNFCIRVIGYAVTAEDLLFSPSEDFIVHI